jgi:ferredoxin
MGNIHFDGEDGVSRKCDLCGGDPACVRFCTSGALRFVEAEDAAEMRREALDASLKRLVRPARGGR